MRQGTSFCVAGAIDWHTSQDHTNGKNKKIRLRQTRVENEGMKSHGTSNLILCGRRNRLAHFTRPHKRKMPKQKILRFRQTRVENEGIKNHGTRNLILCGRHNRLRHFTTQEKLLIKDHFSEIMVKPRPPRGGHTKKYISEYPIYIFL